MSLQPRAATCSFILAIEKRDFVVEESEGASGSHAELHFANHNGKV
jgi:hypothetical protein